MRLTLATKITITIAGVLVLALMSTAVALVAAWEIRGIMAAMIVENLPSVRAAEELEIALLDQRGLVSSFIQLGVVVFPRGVDAAAQHGG